MLSFVYVLSVALMLTHELDAVRRHEWRILPGMERLPDARGAQLFVWVHAPLVAALLWFSFSDGATNLFRAGFCVFCIVHAGLHWWYRNHPFCEFNNPGSRLLIWMTGISGAAYLVLLA